MYLDNEYVFMYMHINGIAYENKFCEFLWDESLIGVSNGTF